MKLVFATHNKHKTAEVSAMLDDRIQLVNLGELDFHEDIPETADTIQGNALQKAHYIYDRFGLNCFADDTGLEVEALDGAPGIYTARFAGPDCNFDDNVNKLLSVMQGKENRHACFKTAVALILDGKEYVFEGIIHGTIPAERHGLNGFGYDPVFQPDGYEQTFAEMGPELKNKISHRALAVQELVEFLHRNFPKE